MTAIKTLVNGAAGAALSADNRGLDYGDGLFETMAAVAGQPLLWNAHWQRLYRGSQRLGLALPADDVVRAECEQLAALLSPAVVKLVVFRAASGRGYRPGTAATERVVSLWPWPSPEAARHDGIDAIWCRMRIAEQPALAGIKTLNRLEQVLAQAEWRPPVAEGLMRGQDGRVIEGTMSNVFLRLGRQLLTPDLTGAGIAGVMRQRVIHAARQRRVPVVVTTVSCAEVEAADELFVTNAVIGIWPIRSLAGRRYPVGPLSQDILQTLVASGDVASA